MKPSSTPVAGDGRIRHEDLATNAHILCHDPHARHASERIIRINPGQEATDVATPLDADRPADFGQIKAVIRALHKA